MVDNESVNSGTETESAEEDIEPKFKYIRIGNDLTEVLNKDVVTCCAVHPKFLIFGTFLGHVYLFDHQGNSVISNLQQGHSDFNHTEAVNHIDIDSKAEYVATCSDDGKVNITGLFSSENNQNITYTKSVKTIVLDPDTKLPPAKRFIIGDNNLTLYEKTFMKKLKSSVLCKAEGYVLSVCWNGPFVAWASCLGVRVYDLNEKCSLGLMKWEEPSNARLENFRCNFRWSNAVTLLIGWVDTIRICVIRKRNSIDAASRDLPGFIVDPVSTFQTTFYICGLAPLTSNQLVALGYLKKKDDEHKALRPVLTLIDYKMNSYEELCTDSLSLRGYQEYTVNDYSLGCIMEENRYIIIAPKDIVAAVLIGVDEKIQWLIAHKKFEEAMELTSIHGGNVSLLDVGRLYIKDLLRKEKYDEAGKLCLQVLGNNKSLWEEIVIEFCKCKQLSSISAYLPTSETCKLGPECYEMVLYQYLRNDAKGFLNLIKGWPSHLYQCQAIINAINKGDSRNQNSNEILESLAILYSHQGDYENALQIYLRLQNKDVFDLIRRHNLYSVIHKMIVPLIKLDRDRAFQIFLDKSKISTDIVVQHLENNQEYLYWYLDALDRVNNRGIYHWKLANLYAKYNRGQLLPLLKRSKHYPLQEAYELCKRLSLYPEMVYVLGQVGKSVEALHIIIDKLNDMKMAIEFCKEHQDTDLWDVLIDESITNPQRLVELLNGTIGYYNPESIINKIQLGQKIPHLRETLTKILMDYSLQIKILEDCRKIQLASYYNVHAEIVHTQSKAISVSYDNVCQMCKYALIKGENIPHSNMVAFKCGHIYHANCVADQMIDKYCIVCTIPPDETTKDDF